MERTFIVFRTYSFPHEAEMDLNKLKSEGVDVYLSDTNMGSFSFLGAATGGVKIHVSEDDLVRADEILSDNQSQSQNE